MKRTSSFILAAAVFMAGLTLFSCNKNDDSLTGSIEFGMEPILDDALKSAATQHHDVVAALVTIVNKDGVKEYDKEYLPFYTFGESYVTKSLRLNVGRYRLTEFMLVDSSGTVTWATPAEGSRLAPLVDDPVPMPFSVYAENTTHLNPQVVRVANHHPRDFGYVNFDVDFIDRFCINLYFESLYGWPMSDSLHMQTGYTLPYYRSRVVIYSGDELLTETSISEGENRILVPMGYEIYTMRVYDYGNQLCFQEMFGAEALKLFRCEGGEFLHITCGPEEPDVTITPEDIKEPTIEQGVFGQITDPGLDYYMLLNDSKLMDSVGIGETQPVPMITDIYLYKTDFSDTVFYPVPASGCYYYPDQNIKPHAVVRTNSSGYYQLPLAEGEYAYLVKTPFGFYIDAYVSSHVPGRFKVRAGEVTMLNIYVQPCTWF